jgi:hypothetical protein
MAVAQMWRLRQVLNGSLELRTTVIALIKMLIAATAFGFVAYGVWYEIDQAAGVSLIAQIVSVFVALAAAAAAYITVVLLLRVAEARQLRDQLVGRFRGNPA